MSDYLGEAIAPLSEGSPDFSSELKYKNGGPHVRSFVVVCLLAVSVFAQASIKTKTVASTITNGTSEISVMAYNVANLFDTKHDEGKADWAYLPVKDKDVKVRAECAKIPVYPWRMECLHLDWNDQVLTQKMGNVARSILSVNKGRGPDVLIVEEVENIGVLNQLNSTYLKAAGYTTVVLIEGNDDRGIDQAMLSRLPVSGKPVNDHLPLGENAKARKEPSKTRGLLQVTFALPDQTLLTVFGVHFPSGDAAHNQRVQAIQFLNKKKAALPADRLVVVGGDFNINSNEDEKFNVYSGDLKPWMISHMIGCDSCIGTEYYKTKKEWSFLDALGFSKNLTQSSAAWNVDTDSIQVPQYDQEQLKTDGSGFPASFNAATGKGVSDHLPIFAVLKRN